MSTQPSRARPGIGRILAAATAAAIAAGYAAPASAVPIETENWTGSWDTTLSLGALWRVESPDCRLIANANGGCGRSAEVGVTRIGRVHFCGDGATDMSEGLCSARVALVASMQANVTLALLMGVEP